MLLEILRELRQTIKERKQEEAFRAQLMKMPLNYDALEHLANKYKDRKITISIEGGHTITLEPRNVNGEGGFKTFKEKYEAAHKNY